MLSNIFKTYLLIGICAFSINAHGQKIKPIETRLKGLDAELNEVLETWKAAGFAVAVVEKNKVVYAKGFGYSDYENKIPATANTLFAIGSCSKAFTTSIIGVLQNEGLIDINERPQKYIPELKFFNAEMNDQITIKDMMSHRTGLPRHDFSWYFFPSYSKDSLLMRVAHQEPFANVRERWYYNNFMFLAQGAITERITGKSWEDNVREKLFAPLGMSRSNLSIDELEKNTDASFGYQVKNETEIEKMDYYHIAGMSPAGSINSSVNEMSNWLKTWINGGKYNGEEIIPASFVQQAISSQMVVGGGTPGTENPDLHLSNYGFGWFSSSYKGHYRVEHGGNIDGFSASTSFFPSDSIGIVVLVNQNGSSVPGVVRNIIADRVLSVKKTDWNVDLKARRDKAIAAQKEAATTASSARKKGTKTSHIYPEFTGKYSHPGYGEFELVLENDSLFAKFPLKKLWLRHYHYDIFEQFEVTKTGIDTAQTSELRFNFRTNDTGDISTLNVKLEAALDPLEFKRTPVSIDVDKDAMAKYPGEYSLGGTTTKVYLKKELLYLFVPGQPEYELLPTAKHKFSIKVLDGYKVEFVEKDNGEIEELLFIQPNGTFTAKKK